MLVPTAHDEPPLRFRMYERVFALPRALAFLTGPEEALVRSRFDLRDRPALVAGIGVETPAAPDVEGFRIRHDLDGPYVLYAGRIDAGKGCAEMLAYYERYRRDRAGAPALVLIGKLAMPEPRAPGVRYLGYLPEDEKLAAMAGARAVLCPSPFESLSIVLLEALRARDARARERAAPRCSWTTAAGRTPGSGTRTRTSSRKRSTCSPASASSPVRLARTGGPMYGRTSSGPSCSRATGSSSRPRDLLVHSPEPGSGSRADSVAC